MMKLTKFLLVFPDIDILSFTKIGDSKFCIVFHPFSFLLEQMLEQMLNKKTALIDEQKKNKRYFLDKASSYLRMAIPTIRLHRSKIGGTKIGKHWTFTQEELDRFLEKHKTRVIN
jgi:hypothetical protein